MIQTQGVGRTSSVARWPRGGLTTIIRPRLIILLDPKPVPSPGAARDRGAWVPVWYPQCMELLPADLAEDTNQEGNSSWTNLA